MATPLSITFLPSNFLRQVLFESNMSPQDRAALSISCKFFLKLVTQETNHRTLSILPRDVWKLIFSLATPQTCAIAARSNSFFALLARDVIQNYFPKQFEKQLCEQQNIKKLLDVCGHRYRNPIEKNVDLATKSELIFDYKYSYHPLQFRIEENGCLILNEAYVPQGESERVIHANQINLFLIGKIGSHSAPEDFMWHFGHYQKMGASFRIAFENTATLLNKNPLFTHPFGTDFETLFCFMFTVESSDDAEGIDSPDGSVMNSANETTGVDLDEGCDTSMLEISDIPPADDNFIPSEEPEDK